MHRTTWLLSFLWLALPLGTAAARDETERTLSPYFFVEGAHDGGEPFALESTEVHANVSGVIADVTVEQTYRNGGTVPINARYVFPASTRAAVHAMQFTLGDKRVVAKIKEREQARRDYEAAERSGKTASLLEQERPNVFTMSVANILPGDRVVVQLRYSELLVPTDGVYQFVYPTVVGPRYKGATPAEPDGSDDFVASPYLRLGDVPPATFAIDVAVSTGVPIAQMRCNTHPVDIAWEDKSMARVKLVPNQSFGGNRDFILDYKLAGKQIQSGLLLYEGATENHFLLMVQPPARVRTDEIPAREYVFVLDVSGSMYGFPLDTAKALISDLISHLRPTDTFNVLLFSGDARLMAPKSVTATSDNVQRAIRVISAERGGGGTELLAALQQVAEIPRSSEHVSRSVIVMTDGYIAQERGAFELIAQNLDRTNVFAFGIGSSVNRYLIDGLARVGQGEPFVVTSPAHAGIEAQRFRRYIESPVLTEVAVKWSGFDAYDVEPTKQPDLFAERPIVVFGKWRGPRAGEIQVVGRSATGAFGAKLQVAQVAARQENAALPQLWARSRIARLSDFALESEDSETARQVTALGLQYSLLTQHTSFIAVLEQIRNPNGNAVNVDQPLPLPAGVSELAVGGDYSQGDEPELVLLVGLVLAAFAFVALRRKLAHGGSL